VDNDDLRFPIKVEPLSIEDLRMVICDL
jgi:hypothetical protein